MRRKIRRTGEIIDVITFSGSTIRSDYDKIQFYDSNGSVINGSLNYGNYIPLYTTPYSNQFT